MKVFREIPLEELVDYKSVGQPVLYFFRYSGGDRPSNHLLDYILKQAYSQYDALVAYCMVDHDISGIVKHRAIQDIPCIESMHPADLYILQPLKRI